MPHQSDASRLHASIHSFATTDPVLDEFGRLKLTESGDDTLERLCLEIGQTRLPRRISVFAGDQACLDLWVRNGRLLAVKVLHGGGECIDCASGTNDDAEIALHALQQGLSDHRTLAVSYDRALDEIDQDAAGVSPERILRSRQKHIQSTGQNRSDKAANPAENTLPNRPRILDGGSAELEDWLEHLNDELFEEIELCTGSGQRLRLDYRGRGVTAKLV